MKILNLTEEAKDAIKYGASTIGMIAIAAGQIRSMVVNRKLKKANKALRQENENLKGKVHMARVEGKVDALAEIVKGKEQK